MATYTWSNRDRWFNGLCTNTLKPETGVNVGCAVCVKPKQSVPVKSYFLNDISTVGTTALGPKDIRSFRSGLVADAEPLLRRDTFSSTVSHVAMRFENIEIPNGYKADLGTLDVRSGGLPGGKLAVVAVAADDIDSGVEIPQGGTETEWGSFSKTSAVVNKFVAPHSPGDYWSVSVKSVVNEIFARPGWASGNSITILLEVVPAASETWEMSVLYDTTTNPVLTVGG